MKKIILGSMLLIGSLSFSMEKFVVFNANNCESKISDWLEKGWKIKHIEYRQGYSQLFIVFTDGK